MARKTDAVRLTGTQIDALLAVDEATIRAALQRLRLRLRATDTDPDQIGAAIVELLIADSPAVVDRESLESALMAARVPALVAELQSDGVQADDGEA
jgi:hypothetical protein